MDSQPYRESLSGFLRDPKDDWQLDESNRLPQHLLRLAKLTIGRGQVTNKIDRETCFAELATISEPDLRTLLQALTPEIADPLLRAASFFETTQIRLDSGPICVPPADNGRAIWLRDLIQLVGCFRRDVVTVRWLAVWGGWIREAKYNAESDSVLSKMDSSSIYSSLEIHVGRFLGAVLNIGNAPSQDAINASLQADVLETLSLIARRKHPVGQFGPHVAYALSHAGYETAAIALIDGMMISCTDEAVSDVKEMLASCFRAAIEGMQDRLEDLAEFLEGFLQLGRTGIELPWSYIDAILLPGSRSWKEGRIERLELFVNYLREPTRRQLAMQESDPVELMVALCAESAVAAESALSSSAERLRTEENADVTLVISVLANRWDVSHARPVWRELMKKCISRNTPIDVLDRALSMSVARQPNLDSSRNQNDVFEDLVKVGHRVAEEWDPVDQIELIYQKKVFLVRELAFAIFDHLGDHRVDQLVPLIPVLAYSPERLAGIIPRMTLPEETQEQLLKESLEGDSSSLASAILSQYSPEKFISSWPATSNYYANENYLSAVSKHPERAKIWRALLADGKQKVRERGLFSIDRAINRKESCEETKNDAYRVLIEYQKAQSKKKRPGSEGRTLLPRLLKQCRPKELVDDVAAESRRKMGHLLKVLAERSGIDPSLLETTDAFDTHQPIDREASESEILTPSARKCLEALAEFVKAQNLDQETVHQIYKNKHDPPLAETWKRWQDSLPDSMREKDGSHWQRCVAIYDGWQITQTRWWDELSNQQKQRLLDVCLQESEKLENRRHPGVDSLIHYFIQREKSTLPPETLAEKLLDVAETFLARVPKEIHKRKTERSHNESDVLLGTPGVRWKLARVRETLPVMTTEKAHNIRQRLIRLTLWANANLQEDVRPTTEFAITAVVCEEVSIGDFIRWLVSGSSVNGGTNQLSLRTLQKGQDWWNLGVDSQREQEVQLVVKTLEDIIREQEESPDPDLPEIFSKWYHELPPASKDKDLVSLIKRHPAVEFTLRYPRKSEKKLFIDRIKLISPYDCSQDLERLAKEGLMDDDRALQLALVAPGLVKGIATYLEWPTLVQCFVWIWTNAGWTSDSLASAIGHDGKHGKGWTSLLRLNAPELSGTQLLTGDFPSVATIRRSWYEKTLGALEENKQAHLRAMITKTFPKSSVKDLERLLDALQGTPKRRDLCAAIDRGRACPEILQLALLPIADGEGRRPDISDRLAAIEGLSLAGKKLKTGEARHKLDIAVRQARRTLADNAGLADESQLEWIAGASIAEELAEFERVEIGAYVLQLSVDGSGVHRLITKNGKALKSIPAPIKKSELGKRALQLQKQIDSSFRSAKATLEQTMIAQQPLDLEYRKIGTQHPIVASIFRGLVFISDSEDGTTSVTGRIETDGSTLVSVDDKEIPLLGRVRIAHPLDLESVGVLHKWQQWFADHPPQPIPQVEREYFEINKMETTSEQRVVLWPGFDQPVNIDQAFRVLQSYGWQRLASMYGEVVRNFGNLMAICSDWGRESETVGSELSLMGHVSITPIDDPKKMLPIETVPAIIVSEAVRDLTRAANGSGL